MDKFGQQPVYENGTIRHFDNFRSQYVQARNIYVWLPDHFDPHNSYAVLYMHDGQNIFESESSFNRISWKVDETLSYLIGNGKIKPCIVVGIWNTEKRFQEFTPHKPFLNYNFQDTDMAVYEVLNNSISDEYLKFIVLEVKPFIDSTFNTMKDRDNTFISGSSMGGLVSIYAICEYPEIFGGAACLSTHWTFSIIQSDPLLFNAITDYLKTNLPSPKTHKIYFDRGTETLDSLYSSYQSEVDRIMKENGYLKKSWMTKIFEGDEHSELSWQKRFHIPATFLLSDQNG
jgi:predicted alpha/beta superfamily hydrolase